MALGSLRSRIEKRKDGTLTGRPDRITFGELKDGGRKHYVREDNRSWTRASLFGSDSKAMNITKARVSDYQDARLESGAARNSVRCEVGVLSAAFSVAVDQAMLAAATGCKPRGEMPACCFRSGTRQSSRRDLRRTAARDFRRAGVSEGEIMRLCGWKTRDMFDRYNIIDSADLSRAVAQRFNGTSNDNGKGTANKSVEPAGVE